MASRLYERIASALIGTPLQAPAERLRDLLKLPHRLRHPELEQVFLEPARLRAVLARTITDGMNCIDVGCHLGSVLQQMVELSPTGRHIAFEPIPYKAEWLRKKFPTVDVRQTALSDRNGSAPFHYSAKRSAYGSLAGGPEDGLTRIVVECRRLDDVVPSDRACGLMKIDVEGAEYGVLSGGASLIAASKPLLVFECTRSGLSAAGRTPSEVYRLISEDLGYRIFLPKEWLANGSPLTEEQFANAMSYPFQAFNFVASLN